MTNTSGTAPMAAMSVTPSRDGDPAGQHQRPDRSDDAEVRAAGLVSEALETIERARGHLYAFHQLTGRADAQLDAAVSALRDTGHVDAAQHITAELVGRNVLPGRWTFQIVEEYDDGYYRCFQDTERLIRDRLMGGRRHVYEAEMKERRRTRSHPAHAAAPAENQNPAAM